ncbi:hypothetical protein Sjap_020337 [Stephania japonica]|uniref:Uncharacterized protein n=1 Tax=Stephania japonica TaxID=461633 RepID=A0AAP0F5S3_9MAGN
MKKTQLGEEVEKPLSNKLPTTQSKESNTSSSTSTASPSKTVNETKQVKPRRQHKRSKTNEKSPSKQLQEYTNSSKERRSGKESRVNTCIRSTFTPRNPSPVSSLPTTTQAAATCTDQVVFHQGTTTNSLSAGNSNADPPFNNSEVASHQPADNTPALISPDEYHLKVVKAWSAAAVASSFLATILCSFTCGTAAFAYFTSSVPMATEDKCSLLAFLGIVLCVITYISIRSLSLSAGTHSKFLISLTGSETAGSVIIVFANKWIFTGMDLWFSSHHSGREALRELIYTQKEKEKQSISSPKIILPLLFLITGTHLFFLREWALVDAFHSSYGEAKFNAKSVIVMALFFALTTPVGVAKLKDEWIIDISKDNIKAIMMDMFLAGTDTTTTAIEWAMAELLKSPNTMKKAQEEVRLHPSGKKDELALEILRIAVPAALALTDDPIASLINTAFIGHLALFFGGVLGLLQAIFLITTAKPLLQFMGMKSDEDDVERRWQQEKGKDKVQWIDMYAKCGSLDDMSLFKMLTSSSTYWSIDNSVLMFLDNGLLMCTVAMGRRLGIDEPQLMKLMRAEIYPLQYLYVREYFAVCYACLCTDQYHYWHNMVSIAIALVFGYNPSISMDEINSAAVIHYNGNMKPWLDIALNQFWPFWTKYVDYEMEFVPDSVVLSGDDSKQLDEEIRRRIELEAEERKLKETLEYQRKIENEAKQKHLAEQHKKSGSGTLENATAGLSNVDPKSDACDVDLNGQFLHYKQVSRVTENGKHTPWVSTTEVLISFDAQETELDQSTKFSGLHDSLTTKEEQQIKEEGSTKTPDPSATPASKLVRIHCVGAIAVAMEHPLGRCYLHYNRRHQHLRI